MARPLGVSLPEGARSRGLLVLSGVLLAVALAQFARLSVFMVDPARRGFALAPFSAWDTRHSCVSAYFVAAQAAGEGRNVYDEALYSLPTARGAVRKPRMMGAFGVDVFEYPPPFLLLPRALRLLAPDFLGFRFAWFVLNAVIVLVAIVLVARSLGEPAATRALLLAPMVLASLPMLSALQKGNIQLVVVALSMMAMLLFDRGRPAAGGFLLACATASKLYPGLLIVYLLMRREWRALAWTAGWGGVLTVATLADLGWAPFLAFFEHLPLLLSGEAFPAFRNPGAIANNMSIPGLVFKLKVLGVGDLSFGASKVVGWLYTLAALGATLALARRAHGERGKAVAWLTILVIATLRSPFLPQAYGGFPPVWLLTLIAAASAPTARTLGLALLAWASLTVLVPPDMLPARTLALIGLVPQAATIAMAVVGLRHALGEAEETVTPAVPAPEAVA